MQSRVNIRTLRYRFCTVRRHSRGKRIRRSSPIQSLGRSVRGLGASTIRGAGAATLSGLSPLLRPSIIATTATVATRPNNNLPRSSSLIPCACTGVAAVSVTERAVIPAINVLYIVFSFHALGMAKGCFRKAYSFNNKGWLCCVSRDNMRRY